MSLFEEAFEKRKKDMGMLDKPIISKQNKQSIDKPYSQGQQKQPTIIINVNGDGQQGYTRPMRQPRRMKKMKYKAPKKQEYIVSKAELEQGLKMAKAGGKAIKSGTGKVVGFLKKKYKGRTMQDRTLKDKIRGTIYK